jgi:hypothetical protein
MEQLCGLSTNEKNKIGFKILDIRSKSKLLNDSISILTSQI